MKKKNLNVTGPTKTIIPKNDDANDYIVIQRSYWQIFMGYPLSYKLYILFFIIIFIAMCVITVSYVWLNSI